MSQPPRGTIRYGAPAPGTADSPPVHDVAIVGAGVVGCALAYELSQYRLRVVVIDRNHDVGEGTSKANSAIIHTGFDAKPGTLESELVTRASREWPEVAERLRIPMVQTGALLVAISDEQAAMLPELYQRALQNGVDDVELIDAGRARQLEPNVSPEVRGALLVPRESIIDPFAAPIAFAEVALQNGVDFVLGVRVTGIAVHDPAGHGGNGAGHAGQSGIKRIDCDPGPAVLARIVVNAAGLGSRALAELHGGEPFDINPRRGQFVIYDRHARSLIQRILLPIPTERSKGMLVTPTIFGNLLAGPTAEDLEPGDDTATQTTVAGLAEIKENALRLCPTLEQQPVIAAYAGLRANCAQGSYWIRFNDGVPGVVTVAGIRSTGLTSSIALARHVAAGMHEHLGLALDPDAGAVRERPEHAWPGWWRHPWEQAERVRQRPDYGKIVCACEQVSRGEIIDALDTPLAPCTMDAVKRRTRALTGRCQAFQCGVAVARIIAEHHGLALHQVTKHGPGSEIALAPPGQHSSPAGQHSSPARQHSSPARQHSSPAGQHSSPARQHSSSARPLAVALAPAAARYRVAIIGAGPAGVGAAVALARRGVGPIVVIERTGRPGGVPARYAATAGGVPTFVVWTRGRVMMGEHYADLLAAELAATGADVWLDTQVVEMNRDARTLVAVRPGLGMVRVTADAVVMACGAREMTIPERGWIAGQRPARVYPTMQLLDLLGSLGGHGLPLQRPVVIGSDLIAYAAAAKLRAHGADQAVIVDHRRRPATSMPGRAFFRRWARPRWVGNAGAIELMGNGAVEGIDAQGELIARCDGVVVSGELVPNSELAVDAGLGVSLPGRTPVLHGGVRFSEPGFFAAGNIVGGFHGAQWCYFHGKRAARAVAAYLARQSEPRLSGHEVLPDLDHGAVVGIDEE